MDMTYVGIVIRTNKLIKLNYDIYVSPCHLSVLLIKQHLDLIVRYILIYMLSVVNIIAP